MGIIWNGCGRDESVDDAQKSLFHGGHGIEVTTVTERMRLGKMGIRSIGAHYSVNTVRK